MQLPDHEIVNAKTREKVIVKYLPLVRIISRSMAVKKRGSPFIKEEFYGYGILGLIKAVDTYKEGKGKFGVWVKLKIWGAIIDGERYKISFYPYREEYTKKKIVPFVENRHWKEKNYDDAYLVKELLAKLIPSERKILILRFFYDYSLQEIGEICGITHNTAGVYVYEAVKKLKRIGKFERGLKKTEKK